jgi:tetratricopeptide (TPR) repeat protein
MKRLFGGNQKEETPKAEETANDVVGVLDTELLNRIQKYRKAREINPNDMDTLYKLNCCYTELLNRIQKYRKTLEINPNDMDTLYKLAYCYHETGKYQNSYDAVNKVVEQSPSANAWALKAQNCFLLGLNGLLPRYQAFDMALESCDRALALDNNCHNASRTLINIWREIKCQVEKIIKDKSPDMEQAKQLIEILLQMEDMRPVQYTIVVDVVKLRMELQMCLNSLEHD